MFRQSNDVIYIENNTNTFECPVEEFVIYEPSYESSTPNNRYWDTSVQYITDGQSQTADSFYTAEKLSLYESKIGEYQAAYDVMHPDEEEEGLDLQ